MATSHVSTDTRSAGPQATKGIALFRILGLLVLSLAIGGCGGRGGGAAGGSPDSVVDVGGGRKIYFECYGEGVPTVLLVSGKGDRADTWHTNRLEPPNAQASVIFRTAQFTRVCAYDRPGTIGVSREPSRSDPAAEPATARDGVADLHALLTAALVQGPYVIVGHSYGGLIARLYASTYPNEVAGLVLEDALSEGLYDGLTPAQRDVLESINLLPERVGTVASFAQVTSAPRVRTLPMTILTADRPPISAQDVASGVLPSDVTAEFVEALWSAQVAAQDRLAKLFPGAKHVTKTDSRHYIHLEQPQVVVDSIREVVDAVRR